MTATVETLARPADLARLRDELRARRDPRRVRIRICMTGCRAHGAEEVMKAFNDEIGRRGLADTVDVVPTGCHGFCAQAPVLVVDPWGYFYGKVAVADIPDIVETSLVQGKPVERLSYADPVSGRKIALAADIPFYKDQLKIVLRNCGEIDPTSIHDYIERDGYAALSTALQTMTPDKVVEEVTASGLRGRGGAGFPTGRKWGFTRAATGDIKYLICNADEGDPGAFMDRAVLEGDPHTVIEGMLIAAYAIGAAEGIVYVRAEYPIAVEHLRIAIGQAQSAGLLGKNILGTGFSFTLSMKKGSGAFVCGEETALIASIEGKRGMPRPRPPFPAQSGLWGRPTDVNNIETLANVPLIIARGWEWYSQIGAKKHPGPLLFGVSGHVNSPGIFELPTGVLLSELIQDHAGGVRSGKAIKAVIPGGSSTMWLRGDEIAGVKMDADSLVAAGSSIGTGGVIVMDEDTDVLRVLARIARFYHHESCGQCTPCREGTGWMEKIIDRFVAGDGVREDIDLLLDVANNIEGNTICALGDAAAWPVKSVIRKFRDEFERRARKAPPENIPYVKPPHLVERDPSR